MLLGARLVGRHPSRLAEHERIATELERLGDSLPSLVLKVSGIAGRGRVHLDRGELGLGLALESAQPISSATSACRSSSSAC